MPDIIILLLAASGFYMLLPFILTRIFKLGVIAEGPSNRGVAFTFDDGPHPAYTPELLDLLREHNAKATFFVLGSKAEKYPELIARMHREGHQLAIHNYVHKTNWLMSPWTSRHKQADRTADIIEQITGERPTFYRPPWGLLNLGDLFILKNSYRIVLWSVMVGDWRACTSADQLKSRLMGRIREGSIIVLHDSGDTLGADIEAPGEMLKGLKQVLVELSFTGLKSIRTDELLGKKELDCGEITPAAGRLTKREYKKGYASTP
ncbi:polysaccharide deacetylase family protein [Paenibacillus sp. J22TS3]|uniref:polysaccharide deacetylase family protein n=1 Tax=Paenibacillus sp. J22TS3 TaxID=2807192 RepID=UPI001B0FC79A|nr:polysaccharide deacetylase family protein [Paenibacillus sp. J22TS3]GIP23658.1 polysaccharide deacetylase familiy protein [Paenibacillus sp. J22TS3]